MFLTLTMTQTPVHRKLWVHGNLATALRRREGGWNVETKVMKGGVEYMWRVDAGQ